MKKNLKVVSPLVFFFADQIAFLAFVGADFHLGGSGNKSGSGREISQMIGHSMAGWVLLTVLLYSIMRYHRIPYFYHTIFNVVS